MSTVNMKVIYNIERDTYKIQSDIKKDRWKSIVDECICAQVGTGCDDREPNIVDDYTIRIDIDLSCDSIMIKSNCGNKGLETGILMRLSHRIDENGTINKDQYAE